MFRSVIHSRSIYQDKLVKKHVLLVLNTNRRYSDEKGTAHSDTPKQSSTEGKQNYDEAPEVPTNCCMSGCPTCVWFDYAEKLVEHYKDGDEKAIKEINEKITDPSLKSYILFELRMRLKEK
nr:unnamed protein product [Callosobruchus chinensis]